MLHTLKKVCVLTAVFALTLSGNALADDHQRHDASLQLSESTQYLQLKASYPSEARVSSSFEYEIHVTNTSENIALHDIKIQQEKVDGFEVESAKVVQAESQKNAKKSQAAKSDQNKKKQTKQGQVKQNQGSWTISKLMPGETSTIRVQATSDKAGEGHMCIAVKSVTPVLCLTTKFVKPELEIVKQAPEKANVCETIEFEYYVRNTGSATAKQFTVSDQLPEGFYTADGKENLEFTVDALGAGESRKFVAQVSASQPGSFSSRAVAELQNGQKVRSQKATTQIRQADLVVTADGPKVEYLNRPMTFTVTVENKGDAPAPGSILLLQHPETTNFYNNQQNPRPEAYEGDEPVKDGCNALQFALGTIEPGQKRQIELITRGADAGELEMVARAGYICDAEVAITSETQWAARVIALPALQIYVVDEADPVRLGGNVVYHIVVQNEGDAKDENVQISAELPEGLKFKEASGQTEVKSKGNRITMQPIKEMAAGEKATWTIHATVEKAGEVAINVELNSDSLNKPVTTEEPTRLFSQENVQADDAVSQN